MYVYYPTKKLNFWLTIQKFQYDEKYLVAWPLSLSLCLFVSLSFCLFVYLSLCLSVSFCLSLSLCLSVCSDCNRRIWGEGVVRGSYPRTVKLLRIRNSRKKGVGGRGEGREGELKCYIHTDIQTDRHTDPPKKQVLEEHSLLKTQHNHWIISTQWFDHPTTIGSFPHNEMICDPSLAEDRKRPIYYLHWVSLNYLNYNK